MLKDRGFDPSMVAFFYSLSIAWSVVGRFTTAALGDTIEPRYFLPSELFAFWWRDSVLVRLAHGYVGSLSVRLLGGFGFGISLYLVPTIVGN